MSAHRPTLRAALRAIADEITRLLHRTLTPVPLTLLSFPPSPDGIERMQITFRRQGRLTLAPLRTRYGLMGMQVTRLPVIEGGVSLNAMHLPTGHVPIEDVIRFWIVDLGVKPLARDWNEILVDSYGQ